MLRKLNTTQTHSAQSGATVGYHIIYKEGSYRVYDKGGRFRLAFATLPAAQTYINLRVGAHQTGHTKEMQP